MSHGSIAVSAQPEEEFRLHRVGFGAARIFEDAQSEKLLNTALACGIRHFDTAPSYSYGQSEALLGKILHGVAGASITTKVGIPISAGAPSLLASNYRRFVRPLLARMPSVKSALLRWRAPVNQKSQLLPSKRVLTRDEIMLSLDASLLRLRRSQIEILLIHEPDQFHLTDELHELLTTLVCQGVIKAFGLGWDRVVHNPPDFGQILQCRYRPDVIPAQPARQTSIFHGVLKLDHVSSETNIRQSAQQRLKSALAQVPQSAVIFSASAPHQIKELLRA